MSNWQIVTFLSFITHSNFMRKAEGTALLKINLYSTFSLRSLLIMVNIWELKLSMSFVHIILNGHLEITAKYFVNLPYYTLLHDIN